QEDFRLSAGDGDNQVRIQYSNIEDINVFTGKGDDLVDIQATRARKSLNVRTGDGMDNVTLNNSVVLADPAAIDTGNGNDNINVTSNYFLDKLYVRAGGGTDNVNLVPDNVQYWDDVRLDGGSGGGDNLTTLAFHYSIRNESKGFENFSIV
ncbi:MAG: hypothetical protein KDA75_09010, partial [Planctomycetaceae bacterium]|nr:hypothetical protein [Planctomycetaceae bacterium]